MKKHIFLGANPNGTCCLLKTLASFEQVVESKNDLNVSDFTHESTNWCGCDKIERTCEKRKVELTGRSIVLEKPLIFKGSDDDMGHVYPWKFEVNKICELRPIEENNNQSMVISLSGDETLQIVTALGIQIQKNKEQKQLIEKLLEKDNRENLRHMLAIYNSKIDTLTALANKIESEMNKQ